jgi:hypothetical protein
MIDRRNLDIDEPSASARGVVEASAFGSTCVSARRSRNGSGSPISRRMRGIACMSARRSKSFMPNGIERSFNRLSSSRASSPIASAMILRSLPLRQGRGRWPQHSLPRRLVQPACATCSAAPDRRSNPFSNSEPGRQPPTAATNLRREGSSRRRFDRRCQPPRPPFIDPKLPESSRPLIADRRRARQEDGRRSRA